MNQEPRCDQVGHNLLADFSGIQPALLRDADRVMRCLQIALADAGFHVLREVVHRFDSGGEGITGIVILSESHAALHTYPEMGYLALDIFSCGSADSTAVADALTQFLRPQHVDIHRQPRSATAPQPIPSRSRLAS